MSKGECRHPRCIYRNTKKGAVNNCDYALITGRVRTTADKPLDNRHCEYYADEEASPREREGQSMKIVCKDCDKRHTACWSECGEYKAALEEHLARQKKIKAARHNDYMTKDVQYNGLRIIKKNEEGRKRDGK